MQSVMIAAKARGIATCPQVSFARFHSVIAKHLDMPEDEVTTREMSFGYPDTDASVNHIEMPRRRVDDFASFLGFTG